MEKPSWQTALALATLLALTTGCELLTDPDDQVYDSKHEQVLDGVKLIRPEIRDPEDSSSFQQWTYRLDQDSRLLLRFEGLKDHVDAIRTENGAKVELSITPAAGQDRDTLKTALRLCPLAHNWMMLATWRRAHPARTWENEGGDYFESECVTATAPADTDQLSFDVTAWFLSYPRGKGKNYGLVLLSNSPTEIAGDRAAVRAPRLRWVTTSTRPRSPSDGS